MRRALDENDGSAWLAVEDQFGELVRSWLRQRIHGLDSAEIDDLYADTRERFIRYINRPIGDNYPHIGALLNYWKQCAFTTAVAHQRKIADQSRWQTAMAQQLLNTQVDASAMEDAHARNAFLVCIRDLIQEHIVEEDLRLILYLRFELELPPREICNRHPQRFPTTRIVYNKIDIIKKRLRRMFEAYLGRCL